MQLSSTSNKNGIVQLVESLCKLGDGGITNDTTLFKTITGYINLGDKNVGMALLSVDRNWRFDDSKYTDFPIATIDLVNARRDYTLPASTVGGNASTFWKLNKVQVLDTAGLPYELELLDPGKAETPDNTSYDGVPRYYRLIGNSIRLDPRPKTGSVTLTGGLIVTFQRSTTDFTTSSTTEQPGYMDAYHDLPAYYAAYMYLLPIDQSLATSYYNIFNTRLEKLKSDWQKKDDNHQPRFISRYRSPE